MRRNLFFLIILWICFLACSTYKNVSVDSEVINVVYDNKQMNGVDSLIEPYRVNLEGEMLEVIAFAENDFVPERPCGTLNNWVADAILQSQIRGARLSAPTFCLLNRGALRNSINKGNVTRGDLFKVMPFDNEIVWVEMPISSLKEIESYLIQKGGEPISGARIEQSKLIIEGVDEKTEKVWIITSDYLLNGGDNMSFFSGKLSSSQTGLLLRDVLIEEAKRQGTLVLNDENRMKF